MKETKVTSRTTSTVLDLFSDVDLPESAKEEVREEVGEFLKEQVLQYVASKQSPVSGGGWKQTLSRSYAKFKQAEIGNKDANLEFTGKTLDSLDHKPTREGIELGVFGSRAEIAEGHNNLSGSSDLPERRFLPDVGQNFKRDIVREVDRIIRDKVAEQVEVSRRDVATIRNKEELDAFLKEVLPALTKAQRNSAVLRSDDLRALLDEFNLLRFLKDGQE